MGHFIDEDQMLTRLGFERAVQIAELADVGITLRHEEGRALLDQLAELDEIWTAVATVLEGFDERVFLRNVEGDGDPAWAIKLIPYITALGRLAEYIDPAGSPASLRAGLGLRSASPVPGPAREPSETAMRAAYAAPLCGFHQRVDDPNAEVECPDCIAEQVRAAYAVDFPAGSPAKETPRNVGSGSGWVVTSLAEEPRVELYRRLIEEQYDSRPTGCGGSFGELLCWELHSNGLTFTRLAEKWGISLPTLGELIADHCDRLEDLPQVNHAYPSRG